MNDTDKHILLGIRIHSLHLHSRHTAFEIRHQLARDLCGMLRDDLELIPALDAAQNVIDDDVRNEQVQEGTDHGRNLHSVNKECDKNNPRVHNE